MSDTTKRGYARILGDLKTQFKLESLPTFYQLTKNRPLVCEINIEPLPQLDTGTKKISLLSVASEIGAEIDDDKALMSTGDGGEILTGGKMVGSYLSYIAMMASKHNDKGRSIPENSDVIVIDSFDGAEHSKSNKKRNSLITFS